MKLHPQCFTLEINKVWDTTDLHLFLELKRFTTDGFRSYWGGGAVNKTVRYFDSVILKRMRRRKHSKLSQDKLANLVKKTISTCRIQD